MALMMARTSDRKRYVRGERSELPDVPEKTPVQVIVNGKPVMIVGGYYFPAGNGMWGAWTA